MVEAEKIGANDEPNEKPIDTSKKLTESRTEVVSVKPIKYEVVSGTIGSLSQEE